MADATRAGFLSGVIEGFYGPPWSGPERQEVLGWMQQWGLDTYLYGPKDDLHHRAYWRTPYAVADAAGVRALIEGCNARGIRFVYAVGPGLDIRYSEPADRAALIERFRQLLSWGCRDFCLLFDDIPDRMDPADLSRWSSLASAQCDVANEVHAWARREAPGGRFFFCPTPYCGRMEAAGLGGPGYLETVGRELHPEIDVFWTGPEIVSREITVAHIEEVAAKLRRPPTLWDNLHANDYDGRRFFCGPYSGREPGIRERLRGILTNPNTEQALNFVALRTLAGFVQAQGDWVPSAAYVEALAEWAPRFETVRGPTREDDLALLLDCHYLPYQDGAAAGRLMAALAGLVARDPSGWGPEAAVIRTEVVRLRDLCARMAELRHRPLFHALSRRIWELREEMDLFDRYIGFHLDPARRGQGFGSDFHQAYTYRGGFVARLQRLLVPHEDGSLERNPSPGRVVHG